MHVHAHTPLSIDEVHARLEAAADQRRLAYHGDRSPPKFYLRGLPLTLPAAAEVAVAAGAVQRDVILRLMWGPLPAPFPRALCAVGLLLAVVSAALLGGPAGWTLALLVAALPLAALVCQRNGERDLVARLGAALGGVGFTPRPH